MYHPKNDARVKVITAGNEYIMFQMGNLHGRWPGEPLKNFPKNQATALKLMVKVLHEVHRYAATHPNKVPESRVELKEGRIELF